MQITLASPVLSDAATWSTSTSVISTLPLANMKKRRRSYVTRFDDTEALVKIDFGAATEIDLAALLGENLTAAAEWQVIAATSEAGLDSPAFDTGLMSAYTPISPRIFGAQTYRWFGIYVTDSTNPDGYLDLSRAYLSKAVRPRINMRPSSASWIEDLSVQADDQGGGIAISQRGKRRRFAFDLPMQDEQDAWVRVFDLIRERGLTGDVIVVPDADKTDLLLRQSFYGHFVAPLPRIVDTEVVDAFDVGPFELVELTT